MSEKYALQWSKLHNNICLEPLKEYVSVNRTAYTNNETHDYLLILVADKATCMATAENMRSTLAAREVA